MSTTQVVVERWSAISPEPFAQVIQAFEAAIGHPDMHAWSQAVAAAQSFSELEAVVHRSVGPSGFMEFTRFNLGQILQKEHGPAAPKILRFVIGNPLVMKQMAESVPDAASYAPITVLFDERADGVHISYDRMASYLEPYGNQAALEVARELDRKVEKLLCSVAG